MITLKRTFFLHINISSWFVILVLLAGASFVFALSSGAMQVSLWQWWLGYGDTINQEVLLQLRLPRAIASFSTGALLGMAGALMQVLLRNPLADPYVVGLSGGAAVASVVAIISGASAWIISSSAFFGALVSMFLVFFLAGRGQGSPLRILLTGIVVAAGWGALISVLLVSEPHQSMAAVRFWLMGDLSAPSSPYWSLVVIVIALLFSWVWAPSLDMLSGGDAQATASGVNVRRLRIVSYLAVSFMTGCAVTLGGSIGFVGLMVPHGLRLSGINGYRALLPASALAGGALLTFADTLARTALPEPLPVGMVTAVLGVPLFLYLLSRYQIAST
ncbi:FeCT family ABC superfamily transporter [Oleiphilus messinensis]|uniref:FeCT family ABC superfamily transporter n=1 Tax=Oleiphilus messinensis TaxID=141451 RepID=A0A1Y0I3Q1_9GAMM|nr:iron ABC transporter permease [Oleiphilus messinensis]ARU55041.1 FeCT family ABC superfamily transporter [Oleiphilus messinensis]